MTQPTVADVRGLLDLQDVESRIRRARHHLDALPEQQRLDEALKAVDASRDRAAGLRLELDRAQAEVSRHEKEIRIFRERLASEQQRLYSGAVTDARSMKSMEAEIATTKQHIDDHETSELEAMELLDDLEAKLAAEADEEARLVAAAEQAEAERDEAAKTTLAELAELEVDRDARRDELPNDLLARYDQVVQRGEARAVGELDGDTCTACGVSMPAVQVNKVRHDKPLTTCPCDREILLLVE